MPTVETNGCARPVSEQTSHSEMKEYLQFEKAKE